MTEQPQDRRERYAAAIYERANPGFRWADAHPDDRLAFGWDGDAALVVADEELSNLRAELERLRSLEGNADFHLGQEMARRQLAEGEAGRLRAELATARVAALTEAIAVLDKVVAAFFAEWPDEPKDSPWAWGWRRATDELRRLATSAQPATTTAPAEEGKHACTCGIAGSAFVPVYHYADCPEYSTTAPAGGEE